MVKLGFFGRPRGGLRPFTPPAGNVIGNWAGNGTAGTSGLPDGWSAVTVAGVTLSVLSRTPWRGGSIIEFQFSGTATATGSCYLCGGGLLAASVAPGQVWREQIFAERVGTATPTDMQLQVHWRNSAQTFAGSSNAGAVGANTLAQPMTSADLTAPTNAAFGGLLLISAITSGQSVNLRYKVFAPVMWRIS